MINEVYECYIFPFFMHLHFNMDFICITYHVSWEHFIMGLSTYSLTWQKLDNTYIRNNNIFKLLDICLLRLT